MEKESDKSLFSFLKDAGIELAYCPDNGQLSTICCSLVDLTINVFWSTWLIEDFVSGSKGKL